MHAGREPRVPEIAKHAWDCFWRLERRGRSGNGFGATPISNMEVLAFLLVERETLSPWEKDLIDIMEIERLAFLNKNVGNIDKSKNRIMEEPFSLALFDKAFTSQTN